MKPLSDMTSEEILEKIREIRERRSIVADKPIVVKGPLKGGKGKDSVVTGQLGETLDALFAEETDDV